MMAKGDCFAPRMFRRLLVPSLASSLGLALADMADAVVVGQRMGATGLAAISLSLPLYMVFNVCMHGLGIGGSVRYSRLLGEGKAAAAVACFNRTMRAGLALGVLIALLVNLFPALVLRLLGTSPADGALFAASENYVRIIALGAPLFFASYMLGYFLRSDDQQKLASAGFLVGNGVDILLNLVFVLWLDGGTAGAAWATLLGLVAILACFRTGLATSSQYAFQMAFLLIANNALLRMAGENGVAVFDMVQNASYLILYLYEGTAKAAQPLVSTFYGEKNMVSARRTRSLSLFWGLVAGSVAAALVSAFPGAVCGVFGLRGRVPRHGRRGYRHRQWQRHPRGHRGGRGDLWRHHRRASLWEHAVHGGSHRPGNSRRAGNGQPRYAGRKRRGRHGHRRKRRLFAGFRPDVHHRYRHSFQRGGGRKRHVRFLRRQPPREGCAGARRGWRL